jgi:hypothetical protein
VLRERLVLRGELLHEEIQLDGSRHLAWVAEEARGWRCALHLVVTRDGVAREGEVEVGGPDGEWSAALAGPADARAAPAAVVRARFDGETGAVAVTLEPASDGAVTVTLEPLANG